MSDTLPGRRPTLHPVRAPLSILAELDAPEWMNQGLCAQTDPEAFFPDKGGSTKEAKATCAACDVRTECLDYALEHQERFGIWGGLSERERRRLKKATPAPPRFCALLGCANPIPPERSGNAKYCKPEHAAAEASRRFNVRTRGATA